MKKITKYSIILEQLSINTLEILRQWRNSDKISKYMEYREYITHDMQVKWFSSLDNNKNFYFMIKYNNTYIGMTNIKNIDYSNKCAETGIFIYEDCYLNTDIAFRVSCALLDFCFENLSLEKLEGHILKDNLRAIRFNKFLGYVLLPNQENVYNQMYRLTKEVYFSRRNIITNSFL